MSIYIKDSSSAIELGQPTWRNATGADAIESVWLRTATGAELLWQGSQSYTGYNCTIEGSNSSWTVKPNSSGFFSAIFNTNAGILTSVNGDASLLKERGVLCYAQSVVPTYEVFEWNPFSLSEAYSNASSRILIIYNDDSDVASLYWSPSDINGTQGLYSFDSSMSISGFQEFISLDLLYQYEWYGLSDGGKLYGETSPTNYVTSESGGITVLDCYYDLPAGSYPNIYYTVYGILSSYDSSISISVTGSSPIDING